MSELPQTARCVSRAVRNSGLRNEGERNLFWLTKLSNRRKIKSHRKLYYSFTPNQGRTRDAVRSAHLE